MSGSSSSFESDDLDDSESLLPFLKSLERRRLPCFLLAPGAEAVVVGAATAPFGGVVVSTTTAIVGAAGTLQKAWEAYMLENGRSSARSAAGTKREG